MEKITLNMTPSACLTTCHASQYDIGRQVRFDLVNGADAFVLSGAETVTLKIRRADGVLVENAVPNTSSNYVIWTSVAGECDAAGVSECELRVTDGDDILGSANFLMSVEADAYDGRTQVKSASGAIATFETGLADALVSAVVDITASQASGTPTPSTPLPITGYSSANITRCGVNLWDEEIEEGYIDSSGNELPSNISARSKNFCACVPNVEYRVYKGYEGGNPPQLCWYDINKNFISRETGAVLTATAPSNAYFFKLSMYGMFASVNHNVGVNYPATGTTYHAYNGQTYSIAFGQTVYGGVLDVTRGKLTVTHGYVDLGSINWTKLNTESPHWRFRGYVTGMKPSASPAAIPNIICDIYRTSSASDSWIGVNNIIAVANDANAFFIVDERYTTAEDFTSAVSGHYAIYELATPFDIDLTPEVISAIVGTNNVFADCGDIAVEYLDLL